MFSIVQVNSLTDIQELRELYRKELIFVQDLNAEENVWECSYYQVFLASALVGYFCVDSEKTLWEFYLIKSARIHSQEIFKLLIDKNYIAAAEVNSYDHLLMSLSLDYHKKAACSAYLFRNSTEVELPSVTFHNINFRLATEDDFDSLSEINRFAEDVDFFHDLEEDIRNREVFVFTSAEELLGSGTVKRIWPDINYRDIGMIVPAKHQHKGIGTYILVKLKEYCYDNGLIPVCGCWYFNHASKKTLERAGFLAEHRMIRFTF